MALLPEPVRFGLGVPHDARIAVTGIKNNSFFIIDVFDGGKNFVPAKA
jgi:hypothetical protein